MSNPYVPGLGVFLRDFFAGQALSGELASSNEQEGFYPTANAIECAKRCYAFADAMLEARTALPQPVTTLGGFKFGDVVELIEPSGNGADVAAVVGFNFGDPSRPLITVKPHGNVRPYDSDPALWKVAESFPAGIYRTPAGRIVHLVNYATQTECCWLKLDGEARAFIFKDGAVRAVSEMECFKPLGDVSELVPNTWPLPDRTLANIDEFIANHCNKTQADGLIKQVAESQSAA